MASRWISEPLCLFDNCLETDGALAWSSSRPSAPGLPAAARVRPFRAQGLPAQHHGMVNYWTDDPLTGPAWTARSSCGRRDFAPQDVDVAQIYDAFTPLIPLSLEGYGFCGRGEGAAFTEGGTLELGGRLPINTAGGGLSEAYVHGFNLIIEGVRQLRGTSTCQVHDAQLLVGDERRRCSHHRAALEKVSIIDLAYTPPMLLTSTAETAGFFKARRGTGFSACSNAQRADDSVIPLGRSVPRAAPSNGTGNRCPAAHASGRGSWRTLRCSPALPSSLPTTSSPWSSSKIPNIRFVGNLVAAVGRPPNEVDPRDHRDRRAGARGLRRRRGRAGSPMGSRLIEEATWAGWLDGVTVVDFSWGRAGPFASGQLADHGADVVKVEPPGGDPYAPYVTHAAYDRGKRSIIVDLAAPEGHDVALRLVDGADVVLESWRPGVADRLGLGYTDLFSRSQCLVYCSISGAGTEGGDADLAGYESLVAAAPGSWPIGCRPARRPSTPVYFSRAWVPVCSR